MNPLSQKNYREYITIDDFLDKYNLIFFPNIKNGIIDDSNFRLGDKSHKILPIVQLATIKHAKIICKIFKDVYNNTYPFKKLEDKNEIKYMIRSPKYKWLIFSTLDNEIIGCVGVKIKIKKKIGYIFGLAIKKRFQGKIDFKTWLLSIYYLWNHYKNRILIWTSEVRTYSKTPLFGESLVGLKPVGFLPNKDIFNNKIESEFLTIVYDKDVFKKHRSPKKIRLLKEIQPIYEYSNERYDLGKPIYKSPILNLNKKKILRLKDKIIIKTISDKYQNTIKSMRIKNSNSYFQFQYNSINNNIENVKYFTEDLEELIIFIRKLRLFIEKYNVRYAECYVSAYSPKVQKVFYETGFRPSGYLPCIQYDKGTDSFQDTIIFNYYQGTIDPTLEDKLSKETKMLYRIFMKIPKILFFD